MLWRENGGIFEGMIVLQLHYSMAVKIKDLQLYNVNLERTFAFHFMTL